jgi:hypothetical protein
MDTEELSEIHRQASDAYVNALIKSKRSYDRHKRTPLLFRLHPVETMRLKQAMKARGQSVYSFVQQAVRKAMLDLPPLTSEISSTR